MMGVDVGVDVGVDADSEAEAEIEEEGSTPVVEVAVLGGDRCGSDDDDCAVMVGEASST
jgi:hypothetical protein